MHHRSCSWVSGHFRNGSWVEGHYRSGTEVHDSTRTITNRQVIARKVMPDRYSQIRFGSITFQTDCWWCGDTVFFHRNDNGGCVLFDNLGQPWPVHDCWLKHSHQHNQCIEKMLEAYEKELLKKKVLTPSLDSLHLLNETIHGFILSNHPSKLIINRVVNLVDLLVQDYNGIVYKVLIPKKATERISKYSLITIHGRWCQRGATCIYLAEKFIESGPESDEYTVSFNYDIEALLKESWSHRSQNPHK